MNFPRPRQASEFFLIAANILPLVGALFWDWQVFEIMLVFWLENVMIGLFNILKMTAWTVRKGVYPALALVVFFILHYGGFAFGHFVVLMALFGDIQPDDRVSPVFFMARPEFQSLSFFLALGGLFASHLFSFCINFIGRKEIDQTHIGHLMIAPYKRVVMLHVTLIIGGFAALALGQPVWALCVLIFLKICGDLIAHRKSHATIAEKP